MEKYIKSPLNYTGGKYKLLKDIIPLFPNNIDTFVDLFGGGFNVGINIEANKFVYNDILIPLVEILRLFYLEDTSQILKDIDILIEEFDLSKTNKEGYLKLRELYNSHEALNPSIILYTLICFSFNNQIRFNKKGGYNVPFGKDRSSFNPSLREKLIRFVNEIKKKNITFLNINFKEYEYKLGDFLYCDPPYLNSVATYNENGGWTLQKEKELLEYLDKASKDGIKWALSNNLKYGNPLLEEWAKKYNIYYLNADYSNCSYHKIDRTKGNEILITNY